MRLLSLHHLLWHNIIESMYGHHMHVDMAIAHAGRGHYNLKRREHRLDRERHALHQQHHRYVESVLNVIEAVSMGLGHHQEMPRIDRMDGQHDDKVVVLEYAVHGHVTLDDAAEETSCVHVFPGISCRLIYSPCPAEADTYPGMV